MTTDIHLDDVEPIPDAPTLMHRETAQSYLGRLAAYYGYPAIKGFCRDFGLDCLGIQSGQEASLRHLARLTGADDTALIRWTPVRIGKGLYRLGDVEFTGDLGPRAMVKQCPACARNAMAANPDLPPDLRLHTRAEWIVDYIETCDEHDVRLVTRRSARSDIERADPSCLQASIYEDLEHTLVEHAEPTAFERYALSLLRAEETPRLPFVSDLNSIDLPRICSLFGADIARHGGPADQDQRRLRELGFAALSSGPAGLLTLFAGMSGKLPKDTTARGMAPTLVRYLDRTARPELELLKQQLFDLSVGDADAITGHLLTRVGPDERATGSFVSARIDHQVPWPLLLTVAKRVPGLKPCLSEDGTDILVDRAMADELFRGRVPLVSGIDLIDRLGHARFDSSRLQKALTEGGVITRFLGDERLSLYSLPEVDRQIGNFLSAFPQVEEAGPHLVTLHKASLRTRAGLTDLLTMLVRRQLAKVVVVSGRPLINAIRVDLQEVFEFLFGDADPVMQNKFSRELGITPVAAIALIDGGHLTPLRSRIATNPERPVSRAELNRFRSRFMRVREACEVTGASSAKDLRNRGLEPAISIELENMKYGHVTFYARPDVERYLSRIRD